jgi:ABC-type antimicrobial peptide transport system permease subunit
MVLRDCLMLATAGVLIGIPLSLSLSRFAGSQLYGVTPRDPAAIAAAMLLLGVMAAVAGSLPAYRASRVDPMVALRYE